MGGLYIHIPFCKQACRYCDFYFTVSSQYQDPFTEALLKELEQRASEQEKGSRLETLYLGGGTPSILRSGNLERIIATVRSLYSFSDTAEISIECNPDDLDETLISKLRDLGFNRISLGIQSFRDEDLLLMRRSHSAAQASQAVHQLAAAGFDNITVDLIYGIPGQDLKAWGENIQKALELPVNHISAYHLTFEAGTVFDHWRKKGRISPVPEEKSVEMYRLLKAKLAGAGYEHYEISNFARKGWRSRHNQLYWSGQPYLGFGPSAHSFSGSSRHWNVSSLKKYMQALEEGSPVSEKEELTEKECYHDYLITALRTSEGADPAFILERFGESVMKHFNSKSSLFISSGRMIERGNRVAIESDSWLLADHIMRALFLD
jgi:oxygen-independent coproporphyrinogen-3 oxidase